MFCINTFTYMTGLLLLLILILKNRPEVNNNVTTQIPLNYKYYLINRFVFCLYVI